MRLDQRDEAVVDLLPHLARHDCFQWRAGDLDAKVDLPSMSLVDDNTLLFIDEIFSDCFYWFLGRRKPYPLQLPPANVVKTLQGKGEMGAAPRLQDGVDLVDDDHARALQHGPRALGGQEKIERLGCGDEDVRRRAKH